jgi:cell division protein FtsW
MAKIFSFSRKPDYFLFTVFFVLVIFGLVILASASSSIGKAKFNDTYYYLKRQILYGVLPGILGFLIAYFFPYQKYKKLALFFLLINIFLLVLVKFSPLGVSAGGASRWLRLGPISFQPSELLKITYIIYISAWLSNARINRTGDFIKGFLPFVIISGIIGILLYIQPATSAIVILIGSGTVLYFIGGVRWKYFIIFALFAVIGLSVFLYLDNGYRFKRIVAFLDPSKDIYGSAYHLNQALITIGSGGWTGLGFGQSTTKSKTLPEPIGDSIFAVMAQELGFVGAVTLIALLMMLVWRIFYLSFKTKDKFGQLILIGFGLIISIQSIVHIGVLIRLLPPTGVPLPFVSYGGTALAVFMTMMGIALNVSKR